MVNIIPPDHVDDVPIVEPNQHDDVLVDPEPIIEDEDKDPEEDEFEEEEDDMEVDNEEDENEPELTYPYEEVKSSTAAIPRENGDSLLPGFMRRDIDSLFGRMVNFSRRLCGCETTHALVEKKGKAKDKFYGKLILDLGNEVRSSVERNLKKQGLATHSFVCIMNESIEISIGHEFYQEMIRRGFVFEERPNEAINVLIEDEKSPLNDASGSGPVRGRDTAPAVRECTFAGFMKCNPAVFCGVEGAVKLRRWFEKTESVFEISECVEGKKVKFAASTLEGPSLTWWKTKVATMGLETVN
ncbi:hypothetical protein Tco_1297550 [Tanacetum coccineum]